MATTSKALFAERKRLQGEIDKAMAEDRKSDALVIQGQIKQIDISLDQVLDDEEKMRAQARRTPAATMTLADAILGPRDEFTGLEKGFKKAWNEDGGSGSQQPTTPAAPTDPGIVYLPGKFETDYSVPGKDQSLFANFLSTIQSVPATGSISFLQRVAQTGMPDTWDGVDEDGKSATKAKVHYAWKPQVANQEPIAGYVPMSKQSLKDYDELYSTINSDLLADLAWKKNNKCLVGNNPTGIIGAINTQGILEFEDKMAGMYYDAIRWMRTKVMMEARRVPTCVAINPLIKTAIDLYKNENKTYQFLGDNIYWGMTVIEDESCDGIMVYDPLGAKLRPVHGIEVSVGTVNDQFVKNELCLLAEETDAFQVTRPDCFCHASKTNLDGKAAA